MKGFIPKRHTAVSLVMIVAAMAAAVHMSGCATTAGIEATGKKSWNQEGAPELSKKVVVNGSLGGDIEVVDLKSAMAGNLMQAQVSLRSKDRDTIPIQYRFDWYDAQGMEIAANATAWKPLLIYGRETKTIQGVAPDPRAHEFKLKIREADKD